MQVIKSLLDKEKEPNFIKLCNKRKKIWHTFFKGGPVDNLITIYLIDNDIKF